MPDTPTDEKVRSFSEWITDHARGSLDDELTATLADVVLAVTTLQKPGTLTLTVRVEPIGTGDRTVVVSGQVKSAPPQPAPPTSIFFPDDSGGLHRDDPGRPSLFNQPPKENTP